MFPVATNPRPGVAINGCQCDQFVEAGIRIPCSGGSKESTGCARPLGPDSVFFVQLLAKFVPSGRLVHLTLRLAPLGNSGSAAALPGVFSKWGSRPLLFCESKASLKNKTKF